ncbi:hypothetical protein [Thermosporothrix hazakensis]|uniref:hypothetical protein n=1 Tax=Thermosporothrix hazakensis TaxID=644383 RepID=UPI000DADDB02|nr:hypothetical protein [Thermosporothrix hazakensis]GCE50609.1 hypothetical protein KTH_54780 [Thermosporothrix hazakensis]
MKHLLLPLCAVILAIGAFAILPGSTALAASAPTDPCTTDDNVIRLRTSLQGLLPTTTITITPCAAHALNQQQPLTIDNDGTFPAFSSPWLPLFFSRLLTPHASTIFQTLHTCSHPEQGVSFSILLPTLMGTLSGPISYLQATHPTFSCVS